MISHANDVLTVVVPPQRHLSVLVLSILPPIMLACLFFQSSGGIPTIYHLLVALVFVLMVSGLLIIISLNLFWVMFVAEKILVSSTTVTLEVEAWRFRRIRRYELADVTAPRILEFRHRFRAGERVLRYFAFDYRGNLVRTARSLSEAQAAQVIPHLRKALGSASGDVLALQPAEDGLA